MLTDAFIKEEAKRRLAAMPTSERMAKEARIRSGVRVSYQVSKEGYKSLTKPERAVYHSYNHDLVCSSGGGDFNMQAIEFQMKKKLNASRKDIASMKKNPFMFKALRALLIMVIVCIGGVLLTALIGKFSGWDMGYVYIGFSTLSGSFAMVVADYLLNAFRFRKLQKAYENPAFQESEINAAVFRLLNHSVKEKMKEEAGL